MNASSLAFHPGEPNVEAGHPDRARSVSPRFFPWAMLYLALPTGLYLLTWLRPVIGWPAAILVMACVGSLFKSHEKGVAAAAFSRREIWCLAAVALLWAFLSGAGTYVPQSADYLKHNLLIHDLETKSWPVLYETARGPRFLCYSLSYYLLPSAIGSAGGEAVGNIAFLLWTAAGFFLVLYWIGSMNSARPWSTLGIFLLVAGLQFLWQYTHRHFIPMLAHSPPDADPLQVLGLLSDYTPALVKGFWTPQHDLAGWLGIALLYELLYVRGRVGSSFLAWTVLLGWSPLASVGLVVIPLAWLFRRPSRLVWEPVSLSAGAVLFVLQALYFSGHDPIGEKGFIWRFHSGLSWPLVVSIYALAEVLLVAICVWLIDRRWNVLEGRRTLFNVSVALLVLLPLYKFGFFGDLRMQAANGPCVFLALGIACSLTHERVSRSNPFFICLAIMVAITAATSLLRATQYLVYKNAGPLAWRIDGVDHDLVLPNYKQKTLASYGVTDLSAINKISEQGKDRSPFDLAAQYLGRTDSFVFNKVLAPQQSPAASKATSNP